MSDRTRSNPKYDKIPTKLGPKNSSDRQQDVVFLINSIKQNEDKIQQYKSDKTLTDAEKAKKISRAQDIVKNCKQTILREALRYASANMLLTSIIEDVDKNNYDVALKKAAKIKDAPVETFFTAAIEKKQRG